MPLQPGTFGGRFFSQCKEKQNAWDGHRSRCDSEAIKPNSRSLSKQHAGFYHRIV